MSNTGSLFIYVMRMVTTINTGEGKLSLGMFFLPLVRFPKRRAAIKRAGTVCLFVCELPLDRRTCQSVSSAAVHLGLFL